MRSIILKQQKFKEKMKIFNNDNLLLNNIKQQLSLHFNLIQLSNEPFKMNLIHFLPNFSFL